MAPLGSGSDRPVYESEVEIFKFRILTSSPFLPTIPAQPFNSWKPFVPAIFGYST